MTKTCKLSATTVNKSTNPLVMSHIFNIQIANFLEQKSINLNAKHNQN